MKLYIMKKEALNTLKENLPEVYGRYYKEDNNKWISEVCGENPFIEFRDVPDFELTKLDSDWKPGEVDLNNCKILYEKLKFLSESQASDERLWAGLAHSTFYDYMCRRWKYGHGRHPKAKDREAGEICSRFFLKGGGRGSLFRNTLAKYWWVGHNSYDPSNTENHFENLDVIGVVDFVSKVHEIYHSNNFSSNPNVRLAIIDSLRKFNEEGKKLIVKDHIRPALQYLNVVGGSVVIDCLSREEICELFTDAITAIMQGDRPTLVFSAQEADEQDDNPDLVDEENEENTGEMTTVILGCTVTIRNEDGREKSYVYDYQGGVIPYKISVFQDHKVGDRVEIDDEVWEIISVSL